MSKLTALCVVAIFPAIALGLAYGVGAKSSDPSDAFALGVIVGVGLSLATVMLARRDNRLKTDDPHPRG